jgi:hypothetical protein
MRFPAIPAFAAAFLASAASVLPASASSVVYNGGTPDQGGQIFGELPAAVFMNFTLTADTTLTDAHWWGGCYPATNCGGSYFFVNIWADNSGSPGDQIAFRPVGGAGQVATGNMIDPSGPSPWTEYAYDTTFTNVPLLAGNYWISIQETQSEGDGTWGIETASDASAPAGQMLLYFDGTNFNVQPQKAAFYLTGEEGIIPAETPLPAGLPLFASGLGALGLLVARKKRKVADAHKVA